MVGLDMEDDDARRAIAEILAAVLAPGQQIAAILTCW